MIKELKNCFCISGSQLFINNQGELITYDSRAIAVDKPNGEKKFLVNLTEGNYKYKYKQYKYIYNDNNVYVQLEDSSYICVENPGPNWEDNIYKTLDPLATKEKLIVARKRYLEGA